MIRSLKDVFDQKTSIHGISIALWPPLCVVLIIFGGLWKLEDIQCALACVAYLIGIEWVVRLGLLCRFWIGNLGKGNP